MSLSDYIKHYLVVILLFILTLVMLIDNKTYIHYDGKTLIINKRPSVHDDKVVSDFLDVKESVGGSNGD